jgi:hypothetical protein
VTEEMLVTALGVLRSLFPNSKKVDNLFLRICSSLVFKFIILHKGIVFRLSKGLPSGHPLTSIIGSIVNWLVWSALIAKVYQPTDRKNIKLMCQGDDTILKLPPDQRVFTLIEHAKNCGLTIKNPDDCIGTGITTHNNLGAKFLKKYFNEDYMPVWGLDDILENIVSPNRKIRGIRQEEERIKMMFYTAPGRGRSTTMLRDYRLWLLKQIHAYTLEFPALKFLFKKNTTRAITISDRVANGWFNESNYFKLDFKLGIGEDNVANNRVLTEVSVPRKVDLIDEITSWIVLKERKKAYYRLRSALPPPILRKWGI